MKKHQRQINQTLKEAERIMVVYGPPPVFPEETFPALPDEPRPEYSLVCEKGEYAGQTFPLRGNDFLIGRDSSCQICLHDRRVSRRHVLLMHRNDAWSACFLGVNGTRLDGQIMNANSTIPALQEGSVLDVVDEVFRCTVSYSPSLPRKQVLDEIEFLTVVYGPPPRFDDPPVQVDSSESEPRPRNWLQRLFGKK